MPTPVVIEHVSDIGDAEALLRAGFEPVECSFDRPVIGPLSMDHHGQLSHLGGVALRAYRDHFGACRDNPDFVVSGAADADATFAIAALAGLLPDPATTDLTALARLIDQEDLDPLHTDLATAEGGALLLLWKELASPGCGDVVSFYGGVDRWRALTSNPHLGSLPEAALRDAALRRSIVEHFPLEHVSDLVALFTAERATFQPLYRRSPVLVCFLPTEHAVRIGVRDRATAEQLFGAGGLRNVFPKLLPASHVGAWDGSEDSGVSPSGLELTEEHARLVAATVASSVI